MGVQGNGSSGNISYQGGISVSATGRYVVYASSATNLIPGFAPSQIQVYLFDRSLGTVELISQSTAGVPADGDSVSPSVSADGSTVAFESTATNLLDGDIVLYRQIYVRNRLTGVTVCASRNTAGDLANSHCYSPSLSGNGLVVAFQSAATNLVPDDTNVSYDVFVRYLASGTTKRASVSTGGVQGDSSSLAPSLSYDGTYVAFQSDSTNLASIVTKSGEVQIFRHNNSSGETILVSQAGGVKGNNSSQAPSISGDGRYVAYSSTATNLVSVAGSTLFDIYWTDCSTFTNQRVSVSSAGVPGTDWSQQPSISADGNYVAFKSYAKNLVAGDGTSAAIPEVFLRNIGAQTTVRVNLTYNGQEDNSPGLGDSDYLAISQHAESVLFSDSGTTLVQGDTNGVSDVFAVDTTGTSNAVPTLSSISPNTANAGGVDFTLTVNGSNFIVGSVVKWNGVPLDTTYVSATQLTATVASGDIASAGTASVQVYNPFPVGGWSSSLTFTIAASNNPVPTLTSLSPGSATVGGSGFTLTLNGTNFVPSSKVRWNGTDRATVYVSATQLTASIAAADIAAAGTASVTVFNPTPGGGPSNALTFTINNPVPQLSALVPSSATAGGNAFTLEVDGSGFLSGATVLWNGSARATTYSSGTKLTASITAADIASAGTASVTVVNPSPTVGPSNALTFTINNPVPVLSSINPSSANAGDPAFTLDVVGSGFVVTSTVRWNGANLATTYLSATELQASVPAANVAAAGTASVTVFNPTPGGGTSGSQTFTVIAPNPVPTITTMTPDHETAGDPQFTLTVNGKDFVASSKVRWNGSNRPTSFVSANQLTATISASDIGLSGSATVTVFSPAPGGGTSNGLTFTINPGVNNPVPTLTSISPSSAAPGSADVTLTVSGANFIGSSTVLWNGAALATTYSSSTRLTAVIPAANLVTAGTASITVFNPTPGGGTSGSLTFTIGSPKIISLYAIDLRPGTASIRSGLSQEYHLYAQFKMSDNSISDWTDVTALGASLSKTGHGVMVGPLANVYQSVPRTPETAVIVGHFSYSGVSATARAVLTVLR